MKKICLALVSILVSMFCVSPAWASVQLWITKDFNSNVVLEKKVFPNNDSVMVILHENAQVKTSYGGGFVTAINDIAVERTDKASKDWFYYVNGTLAQVGALGYVPKDRDTVWWDFHAWNEGVYISSVVGAFPQPFLSGINGKTLKTVVFTTPSLFEKGKALNSSLNEKGVANIGLEEFQSGVQPPGNDQYSIIIGKWDDIKDAAYIKQVGFFIRFEEGQLRGLDINGQIARGFKDASAILALGGGFEGSRTVWVITGTSDEEVQKAIDLLISAPEKIKFCAGVILSNGEVTNVPIARSF